MIKKVSWAVIFALGFINLFLVLVKCMELTVACLYTIRDPHLQLYFIVFNSVLFVFLWGLYIATLLLSKFFYDVIVNC